jgi:hypothetical protein
MKQHSPSQITATAEAIKAHFIPKDPQATSFSFHFTIPPSSNYRADYEKDEKGEWVFKGYEVDEMR